MAKEFEIESTLNPAFFREAKCRECGSTDQIHIHQFKDVVICLECLNLLFAQASNENEGYYTDNSYAELINERNL